MAVFDSELLRMLGIKHTIVPPSLRKIRSRLSGETSVKKSDREELAAQIIARACVDGLPRFPEQYLYDYYRPALSEYSFSGPLRFADEFFGRIQLLDQRNLSFEVEGQDAARALLLASYGNISGVSLPTDRQLTATILSRYLTDLRELRRELIRQCHLRITEPRSADAMVEQIWQSLQLPPWSFVET